MREVIKIAFRRENITVITAGDAASAIAQFEQTPPDAVITDVIMPDQDGYSVCSQIKQHPQFSATPVILMSGVVNKNVADKAVSVGADELIRKPFQPQELIARVKSFLEPKSEQPAAPAAANAALVFVSITQQSFCATTRANTGSRFRRACRISRRIRLAPRTQPMRSRHSRMHCRRFRPRHTTSNTARRILTHPRTISMSPRPIARKPAPPTFKNSKQKSRVSNSRSRSCRPNCRSSASTIKLSNST